MPIITDLLITTNDLQQYLVDKATGLPLANGVITLYQDKARTVLKNWYYQSGTYNAYTYIALPNPLNLSASGTITDVNGNDTLPFYYPVSESDNQTPETYYITVDNSGGTRQFIRQNFPFEATTGTTANIPTLKNYIINNNFWRNAGIPNLNGWNVTDLSATTFTTLAPSQHDGFHQPDFTFSKSASGATESATFIKFNAGSIPLNSNGDITPEYYLNHNCTSAGTETYKYYQFPISLHIKTLEKVAATFTIEAQNVGGNVNNFINFFIYQFLGTGVTTSSPVAVKKITLTDIWKKYTVNFTFPDATGLTLGDGADDALFLWIGLPTGVTCNINFTLPSIYLSKTLPTNNFVTYDETDAVINSPRTGDFRHSLNAFGNCGVNQQSFGWIPANDGTIGLNTNATIRNNADTWPLYNLIYNSVLQNWAPVSGYTGNAYNDFSAGNLMTISKNLGRVLMGQDPSFITPVNFTASISTVDFTSNYGGMGPNTMTLATSTTLLAGQEVYLNVTGGTLPDPLQPNTLYYISSASLSSTTFDLAYTLADAVGGNFITINNAGSGTFNIVNTNNVLTLATATNLKAGDPIQFTTTGSLPTPLAINTVYYISSQSLTTTTFTVSDNLIDAENGYCIGITDNGSPTNTLQNALGATVGDSYMRDVPIHDHLFSSDNQFYQAGGPQSIQQSGGLDLTYTIENVTGTTNKTGIEKPTLIQPSSIVNVFIKL